MENDALIVIHGFLQLPNRQKLRVVEALNEYFDSMDKQSIRAVHDAAFDALDLSLIDCKCCGRVPTAVLDK